MITRIDKTEEILAKLREEGKTETLDKPEHLEAIQKMNELLKETHQEFVRKQAASELSAANCWVV